MCYSGKCKYEQPSGDCGDAGGAIIDKEIEKMTEAIDIIKQRISDEANYLIKSADNEKGLTCVVIKLLEKITELEQYNRELISILEQIRDFGYDNPGKGFSCAKMADNKLTRHTSKEVGG